MTGSKKAVPRKANVTVRCFEEKLREVYVRNVENKLHGILLKQPFLVVNMRFSLQHLLVTHIRSADSTGRSQKGLLP